MARSILEGKCAFVAGVECAPARAAAQQLSRAGCRVVLASRDEEKLDQQGEHILKRGGRPELAVLPADFTHLAEVVRKARELVGHFHFVFNALALCHDGEGGRERALTEARQMDETVADLVVAKGSVRLLTVWPEDAPAPQPIRADAWHGYLLTGAIQRLDSERPEELDAGGVLHLRAGALADTLVALFQVPPSAAPRIVRLEAIPSIEKGK